MLGDERDRLPDRARRVGADLVRSTIRLLSPPPNNSRRASAVGVANHQKPTFNRKAERQRAALSDGMVRIRKGYRESITEDRGRLFGRLLAKAQDSLP